MIPTNQTMHELCKFIASEASYNFLISMKDKEIYAKEILSPLKESRNYEFYEWVP